MDKIKVLVFPVVGKQPVVKEIQSDNLEDMQGLVGGYLQVVDLGAISGINELQGYDLYCNEEGKMLGLPLNKVFPHDFIAGQYFISKLNSQGETITLTDEDIELIKRHM